VFGHCIATRRFGCKPHPTDGHAAQTQLQHRVGVPGGRFKRAVPQGFSSGESALSQLGPIHRFTMRSLGIQHPHSQSLKYMEHALPSGKLT